MDKQVLMLLLQVHSYDIAASHFEGRTVLRAMELGLVTVRMAKAFNSYRLACITDKGRVVVDNVLAVANASLE